MKNKIKPIIVIVSIFVLLIIAFTVLGTNKHENTITELRFKDLVAVSELEKLANTKVSIVGFISPISPISGKFAYIMNMPFQSCPFCVPNSTELTNTLTAFSKSNEQIEFTDRPVKITGILKFGNFTDENGYEYTYKLDDISVEYADESQLGDSMTLYGTLAKAGIFNEFNNNLNELWAVLSYDGTDKVPTKIDLVKYDTLIAKVKFYKKDEYTEFVTAIEKMKNTAQFANQYIDEGKLSELQTLQDAFNDAYYNFNTWIVKFDV